MDIPIYLVGVVGPVFIQGQKCSKMFLHQGLSLNVIYRFASVSKSTGVIAKFRKTGKLVRVLSEIFDSYHFGQVEVEVWF